MSRWKKWLGKKWIGRRKKGRLGGDEGAVKVE